MDQVLQTVTGSEMLSMLDGFSGYNQIEVSEPDQHKTAFTTPLGTFAYRRMPFGLINAGATFQRAMDLAFRGIVGRYIVVYLDDLIVFSKDRENHLFHLQDVLERCRKHDISLNPKNSVFGVTEGKLLGHIVSKEGIKVDSERVKSIQNLPLPSNKIAVHSFFGKVNFLRRFIPDFAEKTRHIVDMMKGKSSFHWNFEGRAAFNEIKDAIAHVPVLEFGTKRGTWIAKIQEYDLEIKPTKLVRGRGLCQLMVEGISEEQELDDSEDLPKVLFVSTTDEWYSNIAFFLTYAIDGTFLRCVDKAQQAKLLESFHDKACGGHFSSPVTAHKILRAKYYWPMLFQDAFRWVRKCIHCQQFVGKPKLAALPLKPVIVEEPFRQWGIDFIGVINPSSSAGHSYVLTATDYFTKWVEAIPAKNANFELLYGINAEILITLELRALKLSKAIEDQTYENALDKRVMYLSQLEEQRTQAVDRIAQHQQQVKIVFDKKSKQRGFQVGDRVFLWDK
ncbi:uncharacterized protein LOC131875838 [Cryptomeria japonica]|uniref:uncharacterized protein LOC131875838 n=1 Tax=Cryptomeria japonica TaxID=3369 RepID=UPI0027DA9176|nr:uncharacterized protein LOC131875838 [Cryptomeria japonica]